MTGGKMINTKFVLRSFAIQILLCLLVSPLDAQVSEERDSVRAYKMTSSVYSWLSHFLTGQY